jgi:hypothetical protein
VTIAAGSGLATGGAPATAAMDAALAALSRSGQDHADLALVFMTDDGHAAAHEVLHSVPDHDVTLIRQYLGEFPLAGFFGNGEFAPVGRHNHFHTYTGVLVLF